MVLHPQNWHFRLNGHESQKALGDGEGQGSLACCSSGVAKSRTRLSDWRTPIHTMECCSASKFRNKMLYDSTYMRSLEESQSQRQKGERWVLVPEAFQAVLVVKNCLPVHETGQTWVRSRGWEDPLEESMATHSSILAWRIPWTEEPGGLQSIESKRVGYNWAT